MRSCRKETVAAPCALRTDSFFRPPTVSVLNRKNKIQLSARRIECKKGSIPGRMRKLRKLDFRERFRDRLGNLIFARDLENKWRVKLTRKKARLQIDGYKPKWPLLFGRAGLGRFAKSGNYTKSSVLGATIYFCLYKA